MLIFRYRPFQKGPQGPFWFLRARTAQYGGITNIEKKKTATEMFFGGRVECWIEVRV